MRRQPLGSRRVLVVAADPERRAERLLEPGEDRRQLGLDRQVVRAVRKHDLVLTCAAHGLPEVLDDRAQALLGVVVPGEAREVVVVREHLARDDFRRTGAPAEDDADVVDLVAHAAREEEGGDAEAGQDLRQLRRVAEAVGKVAGAARFDPEAPADPAAEQEVADERLAADEDLVGQDVRGADLEAPGLQQRSQAILVLRPHLDVVLEHDGLSVEREGREGAIALERVQDAVDDRTQAQPELLEGQVPLAVPVGVRDDEEAEVGHLGHRRSLLSLEASAAKPPTPGGRPRP